MLAYCKYHGIGVIPWSPLAGGRLARPLAENETPRAKAFASFGIGNADEIEAEIIKRVEEVAKKRSRRTVKHQRGIVGADLAAIQARRNQSAQVRLAQRSAAISKAKAEKKAKEEKKEKAKVRELDESSLSYS